MNLQIVNNQYGLKLIKDIIDLRIENFSTGLPYATKKITEIYLSMVKTKPYTMKEMIIK